MSITPEPPLKTSEGRLKHGSILNGNIWLRWVSSQWKSTLMTEKSCAGDEKVKTATGSESNYLSALRSLP